MMTIMCVSSRLHRYGAVSVLLRRQTTRTLSTATLNPHLPTSRTWWAKQFTPDVYTAGRLTEKQFKDAAADGFKSIISLSHFGKEKSVGMETAPDSDSMAELAVMGKNPVHYDTVLHDGEDWKSLGSVHKTIEVLSKAPKPVLIHCNTSRTATFHAANYQANIFRQGRGPKKGMKDLFDIISGMGHHFGDDESLSIFSSTTADPIPSTSPIKPTISVNGWNKYFWEIKPVFKNIYVAGDIRGNYLHRLKGFGIDVLYNLDLENQNVVSTKRLLSNSSGHVLNEDIDTGRGIDTEFQSEIEQHMPDTKVIYPTKGFSAEIEFGEENVLFTSKNGTSAAVVAILTTGKQYGLNAAWAERRAAELGFHFREAGREEVIDLFTQVLGA